MDPQSQLYSAMQTLLLGPVADPGGAPAHAPTGPDSFMLTYKFFET